MSSNFSPALMSTFLLTISMLSGCIYTGPNKQQISNLPVESYEQDFSNSMAPECGNRKYSAEELFQNSKDSIAVVYTDSGAGSAFVVAQKNNATFLITNAHVIQDSNIVGLKWFDGSKTQANTVIIGDSQTPTEDLALLEVSGNKGRVLGIMKANVKTGADIYPLGAPLGLEFTITRGIVSAIRDGGRLIQIDAPINPGNSGGPILNTSGCVVGVSTFIRKDSEGLGFGISSNQLLAFLANKVKQ
jgi:S1-C subfamily serine protease